MKEHAAAALLGGSVGEPGLKHPSEIAQEVGEVLENGDAFTVWYAQNGRLVGALAHRDESDCERGRSLIAEHAHFEEAVSSTGRRRP